MDCNNCLITTTPEITCIEGCIHHKDKPLIARIRTTLYRKITRMQALLDTLHVPVFTFKDLSEGIPYTELEGPSFIVYVRFKDQLFGCDIEEDSCFGETYLGDQRLADYNYFVHAPLKEFELFMKKLKCGEVSLKEV